MTTILTICWKHNRSLFLGAKVYKIVLTSKSLYYIYLDILLLHLRVCQNKHILFFLFFHVFPARFPLCRNQLCFSSMMTSIGLEKAYQYTNQGCKCVWQPRYLPFEHLCAQFLDVEDHGEECKVHGDLVFSEVPEAAVCHIGLHLSENGFGFNVPLPSVLDSFFWSEPFLCLSFVFVQSVVDLNDASVRFCLIAEASQRTPLAVLCAVSCAFAAIAACRLGEWEELMRVMYCPMGQT